MMRRPTTRPWRTLSATLIALVVSAAARSSSSPPGQQSPPVAPPAAGSRAQPPAPGPGRGRVFDPMPDYPANPNDVIQALNGFKVEIVAKADRSEAGFVDQHRRGRPGPADSRRQRAAAVHAAHARQGGQGREDRDDLHAGVRSDGHHLARQRPVCAGRPAREAVHRDHGQPRVRTPERAGRAASPARSEGRRQLHDHRHAAHVGRPRGRPQRPRHPRGPRLAGRQELLHHQRQRRGAAARRVAELAAAQLRRRPHHSAARPADRPPRAREGAGRHHRPDHLRRQGPPSVRRRHAQRAALRLERRRRDLLVRQRHGAGVRRALVPAGARVLDAERRRPRLSRQQRQVSRPGTRTRCRRSSRSGSAARSA